MGPYKPLRNWVDDPPTTLRSIAPMLSLILLLHWLLWLSSCWSLRGSVKHLFLGELEILSTDPVVFLWKTTTWWYFSKGRLVSLIAYIVYWFFGKMVKLWSFAKIILENLPPFDIWDQYSTAGMDTYRYIEGHTVIPYCKVLFSASFSWPSFFIPSGKLRLCSHFSNFCTLILCSPSSFNMFFLATNKYPPKNTRSGPKHIGQKTQWNPPKKGTTDYCPKTAGCVWRSLFGSSLWGPIVSRTMRLGSKKFPGKHHPGDIWMGTFFGGRNSHIYG